MGNDQSIINDSNQTIKLTDNQLTQIIDTIKRPSVNSIISLLKSPQIELYSRISQEQKDLLEITANQSIDLFASRKTFKEINYELFNVLIVLLSFLKQISLYQTFDTYYSILFNADCRKQRNELQEESIEKIIQLYTNIKEVYSSNVIVSLYDTFKQLLIQSETVEYTINSAKNMNYITDDFISVLIDIMKESLKQSVLNKFDISKIVKALHSLNEFEHSNEFEIIVKSSRAKEYDEMKKRWIQKYIKSEHEHLEIIITSLSSAINESNYQQQIDDFFFSVSSILNNGLFTNDIQIVQTFIHDCEIYISSYFINLKKLLFTTIQQIGWLSKFTTNLQLIYSTTSQSIKLIIERYQLQNTTELNGLSNCVNQSTTLLNETIKRYISSFNDQFKDPMSHILQINYNVKETDDLTTNIYNIELFLQKLNEIITTKINSLEKQTQKLIVSGCAEYLVKQIEIYVKKKKFTQHGACEFMKDFQQIQSFFKNFNVPMNCFEKLKQIITILCFDQIDDVQYYISLKGWKLTPSETKLILTFRVDFDKQKIRTLKF